RHPTNEMLPAQLGPLLHVQHTPSPDLGDINRARLTSTPDASATAQGGSNLNRRRRVSFSTAATLRVLVAIPSAVVTSVVVWVPSMAQPTTMRENASST